MRDRKIDINPKYLIRISLNLDVRVPDSAVKPAKTAIIEITPRKINNRDKPEVRISLFDCHISARFGFRPLFAIR